MNAHATAFDAAKPLTGLLVYGSTHGHTATIAARIAASMAEQGVEVDVREAAAAGDAHPEHYDVVVVGGSLHRGHHQQEVTDWCQKRRSALVERPAAFFSVSLSAADDSAESRADAQRCIDEFCAETGWQPVRTEAIAGCLEYREYDVFTRQLMRLLMRRSGRPTDTSHDYEYTDWDRVDGLGREFAALALRGVAV
jgi:menaquinone-dependent protoporphyrinogen oxidase